MSMDLEIRLRMGVHLEISLRDRTTVGAPVPLPIWLLNLHLSPAEMADLTERGYPDTGYVRVVDEPPPAPPPGHVVEQDGWVIGETTASPRWAFRPLTAAELAALRKELIVQVKAEAGRRILEVAPAWKQANLTARAADLALLYPGTKGDELPEPERTEYLAGQAVWAAIMAIRDASGVIEAAVLAAPDPRSVDISIGWP